MSELHTSPSQPQPPAFTPKAARKGKGKPTARKALSAAKVSAKARRPVAANAKRLVTKSGDTGRCQVLLRSGVQCQNPANFAQGNGRTTCSIHDGRIRAKGIASFRFAKAVVAYDKTLWGAPKATPSAAQA